MYAAQIAIGEKPIEYRTWKTPFRGDLLICASQYNDGWYYPRGYALCIVELYDITHNGDCFEWHLRNVRPVQPFKVKGKLHLYDVDDRLIKTVRRKPNELLFDWWQYDCGIITAPKRK